MVIGFMQLNNLYADRQVQKTKVKFTKDEWL